MFRNRALALLAAIAVALGLSFAAGAPAQAGTGLFYRVVDADRDIHNGIYLRNNPNDFADATRIPARYIPYETSVELICGAWGVSVGQDGDPNRPNYNRRWHQIRIPNGQTGWMPDRYLNTPNIANKFTPNEPECGSGGGGNPAPPPPLKNGGSIYFSPYDGPDIKYYKKRWPGDSAYSWVNAPSPADVTLDQNVWQPGCNNSRAVPAPHQLPAGKRITTLAGWSSGRNGPLLYMSAKTIEQRNQIDFVLLIDPGNKDAYYNGSCDNKQSGKSMMLAQWLADDPSHVLMVLAGEYTADYAHPVNGYAHAGIQNKLFPAIRDYPVFASGARNIRSQVVVCNYNGVNHEDMWIKFRGKMQSANHTSCPGSPSKVWHP